MVSSQVTLKIGPTSDRNRQFNRPVIGGRVGARMGMSHGDLMARYWLRIGQHIGQHIGPIWSRFPADLIYDGCRYRHQIYRRYRKDSGSKSVADPDMEPLVRSNADL